MAKAIRAIRTILLDALRKKEQKWARLDRERTRTAEEIEELRKELRKHEA